MVDPDPQQLGMNGSWSTRQTYDLTVNAPGMIRPSSVTRNNSTGEMITTFFWPDSLNATHYRVEVLNGTTVIYAAWLTDIAACGTVVPHIGSTQCSTSTKTDFR